MPQLASPTTRGLIRSLRSPSNNPNNFTTAGAFGPGRSSPRTPWTICNTVLRDQEEPRREDGDTHQRGDAGDHPVLPPRPLHCVGIGYARELDHRIQRQIEAWKQGVQQDADALPQEEPGRGDAVAHFDEV